MERKTVAAADLSRELLYSCKEDPDLRLKKSAFTRQRKLGAERVLHMLLHRMAGPLQLELDTYCEFLEEAPVSKQAFSKARTNLNPAYVHKFADALAGLHAQDSDAPTWCEMRLIAIDGTDIALENSAELKRVFGCSGPKRDAATASGALAYGPLDHAIYDCQIAPYATDERDLAKLHMVRLQELGLKGSLLLFDRWYPSASFLAYTMDAGFFFVMRVREKWNLQVDAIKTEDWVTLSYENKDFSVRVLKVTLSNGVTETLLTNYLAGFASICAAEADAKIADNDKNKKLKYPRKSNQNRTIAKLRDRFWCMLLQDDPILRERMLDRLCADIAARPEIVRPKSLPRQKILKSVSIWLKCPSFLKLTAVDLDSKNKRK